MPRASGGVEDAEPEGGLLSDLREVQCLICCLLHQMFIADPNIAKLVHFQVIKWEKGHHESETQWSQRYAEVHIVLLVNTLGCLGFTFLHN